MPIAANCAGALALINQIPKVDTSSKVSLAGTDIHSAMETGNLEDLEMTEREIAMRLKHLETIALENFLQEFFDGNEAEILREQRFWIRDRKTFKMLASSKIDYGAFFLKSALVIDFKTGYLDATPSEVNWQLKTQAVSVWHEKPQLERVRAGIAAARLKDKLDLANYTIQALQEAEWEILKVIEKTKAADAGLFAGAWCRYCPARSYCRTHAAWLNMDIVPFDGKAELDIYKAVGALAPSAVGQLYKKKKMIELLLEAIAVRMRNMDAETLESIGFQKTPGANRRYVTKPEAIVSVLTEGEQPLISKEKLISYMKVSVGDLDALYIELFPGTSPKQVAEKMQALFGDAIELRPNKESIKPV